jgi:RNA polymerase sigma-70 factor (ECF subfamily)
MYPSPLAEAADTFRAVRPRLFGIAYRIAGNWTEAEDIVQDVWLRWQACDRSVVLNSTAFLVTATTRVAINAATSARARHESCVDRWPIEVAGSDTDPSAEIERSHALEKGLTLLLERLSPAERAAYILRVAFDYPYTRIATLLAITEVNARKIVSRATKNVAIDRRQSVTSAERRRLVRAFVVANHGDGALLEGLFASEVRGPNCCKHSVIATA